MTSQIDATSTSKKERFWKRILIIDDDADITTTFKLGIEDANGDTNNNRRIEVVHITILRQHYQNSSQISLIFY